MSSRICQFSRPLGLGLLLPVLLLAGCSIGRTDRTVGEESYGTSATLHTNRHEAALERGRQLRIEGRYREATESFESVYRSASAEDELRATALLELGRLHSYFMNPEKDYLRALSLLEQLLAEFPDSELRAEAEEAIASIRQRQAPAAGG